MVPQLRKHANLNAENVPCLNISSFAHTLDAVRIRAGNGQFDIWSLNAHVRPQRLFLDIISYSLVLDIRDLSKSDVVRPIVERLGFGRLVDKGVPVLHASTGEEVWIPAHAARMIANFAKIEDRGGGESASKD